MRSALLLYCVILSGCATMRGPLKSEVWEPQTETGRMFRAKYDGHLKNLTVELRLIDGLGDIMVMLARSPDSLFFVGSNVGTFDEYNVLQTRFEDRAATATGHRMRAILDNIMAHHEMLRDTVLAGAFVGVAWTASNFANPLVPREQEAVRLYIPKEVAAAYLKSKITNQEMIDRSVVLGYQNGEFMGRITFNVNRVL